MKSIISSWLFLMTRAMKILMQIILCCALIVIRMQNELHKVTDWLTKNVSAQKAKEVYRFLKTWQPSYNSLNCDSFTNSELADTKWTSFRNHAICRLKNVELTNRDHLIFRYSGFVE